MIRLCGGAVIVVCMLFWGREKASELYERQRITKALSVFVLFCKDRISAFRDPLSVIFAAFENDVLESAGFIAQLRCCGCRAACETVLSKLSANDAALLSEFAEKIGGGDEASQTVLCAHVAEGLDKSSNAQLEELAGKSKMYRLLPALAALSLVILLI